jgi:hypothetical protein
MTENKELRDIADLSLEFTKIQERYSLLHDRFTAIGIDYKHFINTSNDEKNIFELRDTTLYRLYGANFHIEVLIRQYREIIIEAQHLHNTKTKEFWSQGFEFQSIRNRSVYQISTLFDSIIYHLASIYDYIGNLCNYICGETQSNTQAMKWSSLAKSVRVETNSFSKRKIAPIVNSVNNDFVDKLYGHRSFLIHTRGDLMDIKVSITASNGKVNWDFITSDKFCKNFHELRKMNQTHSLTVQYTIFWLVNKAYDTIRQLLFGLRDDMIDLEKAPLSQRAGRNDLIFVLPNPDGTIGSASRPFWKEDNPL